ncbi:MAG: WG repeat-containing protein [Lewinellaceae bacterium]|nr:WG repeat-containing protein [Saprospiraceae bacterium]MCB9331482.1 WG repeat-containing protein [Lewinellaceae bacterium]
MRLFLLACLAGIASFIHAQKPTPTASWKRHPTQEAYAVVNPKGIVCTDYIFQNPMPFRQTLAIARKNQSNFLVRADGSLLPDSFDLILPATDGFFMAFLSDQNIQWLDNDGQQVNIDPPGPHSSAQEYRRIRKDGKSGVVDPSGHISIPILYEDCSGKPIHQLHLVTKDKKHGLMNTAGKLVAPFEYDWLQYWPTSDMWLFKKDGFSGTGSGDWKSVSPAIYDKVEHLHARWPIIKVWKNGLCGGWSPYKEEFIVPSYANLYPPVMGSPAIRFRETDQSIGLMDTTGKIIVPSKCKDFRYFEPGYYRISLDDKVGLLDRFGNEVFPAKYEICRPFDERYFLIRQDNQSAILNFEKDTVLIFKNHDAQFVSASSDLQTLVLKFNNKLGLYNRDFQQLSPSEYKAIIWVNDSLLIVQQDDLKYDLITTQNKVLTQRPYQKLAPLKNWNIIAATQDGLIGFLNSKGEEIIKPKYLETIFWGENLIMGKKAAVVRTTSSDPSGFTKTERVTKLPDYNDGRSFVFVFIDSTGKEIPGEKYNKVDPLYQDLSKVKVDKKIGYIDQYANVIFPPEFIDIEYPYARFTRVRKYNSLRWGIWRNRKEMIPCQYEQINRFYNGFVWAQDNGTRFYLDSLNRQLVLSPEEAATRLSLPVEFLARYEAFGYPNEEENWIRVRQDGKWGWIDNQGKIVIPCLFEATTPFQQGQARVLIESRYEELILNKKGEILLGQINFVYK